MAEIDYGALKKGGFMRQKQKGKFSLRLGVIGGHLTAEGLATVARVAEKYGKGYVHMTSRQGVEIPFIDFKDIEEVKAELLKGGVRPGVCGPRVRTVTACQGSEICPSGCIDSYGIAVELDKRYFGRELPHKFKFGVTGCQNNCLKAETRSKISRARHIFLYRNCKLSIHTGWCKFCTMEQNHRGAAHSETRCCYPLKQILVTLCILHRKVFLLNRFSHKKYTHLWNIHQMYIYIIHI